MDQKKITYLKKAIRDLILHELTVQQNLVDDIVSTLGKDKAVPVIKGILGPNLDSRYSKIIKNNASNCTCGAEDAPYYKHKVWCVQRKKQ